MPSFMYPRTISIKRANYTSTSQDGLHQDEVLIAEDIECNIQLKRSRAQMPMAFPARTNSDDAMPAWTFFIPLAALDNGVMRKGDMIIDDLGIKYIVEAPYWNSLGYAAEARIYRP